ncbi:MAG: AAA family ATPase [Acidimicrobiaceae bacterium]|nr:AAA family ATPase [Acidimicrobiaceae bacterium]
MGQLQAAVAAEQLRLPAAQPPEPGGYGPCSARVERFFELLGSASPAAWASADEYRDNLEENITVLRELSALWSAPLRAAHRAGRIPTLKSAAEAALAALPVGLRSRWGTATILAAWGLTTADLLRPSELEPLYRPFTALERSPEAPDQPVVNSRPSAVLPSARAASPPGPAPSASLPTFADVGADDGGSLAHNSALNQLLTEIDGFQTTEGVLVVGATNRFDMLDPAVIGGGRLSEHIEVPLPDSDGRLRLFQLYTKKMPLEPSVDLAALATAGSGLAGGDIESICTSAAINAFGRDATTVSGPDFEAALASAREEG